MIFTLKIDSENAAFSDYPKIETVRILQDVAEKLERGCDFGAVMDINGNHVGDWSMEVSDNE